MVTGLAHTAICVPDVDEAVQWYADVLGLRVLSPPFLMQGDATRRSSPARPSRWTEAASTCGSGR